MSASGDSNDSAGGEDVLVTRQKLRDANIIIERSYRSGQMPASELIAYLSHWSWRYNGIDEVAINESSLGEDEKLELKVAVASAKAVDRKVIHRCSCRNKARWMRLVNNVVLSTFFEAEEQELLSISERLLWTEGEPTESFPGVHNPRPDFAFGLTDSPSNSITSSQLFALDTAPGIRLEYSPCREDFVIYPSVVYEAVSDMGVLLSAENKAAVGAARALTLLSELSRLSEVPHQHCVVAITSAGDQWKVHVAYQADGDVVSLPSSETVGWPY